MLVELSNELVVKALLELAKARGRKMYLVGGFIRDAMLGRDRDKLDLDFAIDSGAISLAKELAERIGGKFVLLDEVHNIARVVSFVNDKPCEIDFADFRADSLEGDLRLRDFTIDAIAADLDARAIIDPTDGRGDLGKRLISAPSDGAFVDDPCRLLRAFSLAARFNFEIEGRTSELMKGAISMISLVSFERITDELFELFAAKNAVKFIRQMDELGILEAIVPQIKPMKATTQGAYHHLDVWGHSLQTVEELEKIISGQWTVDSLQLRECERELRQYLSEEMAGDRKRISILKFAALLHDIGKPLAKTEVEGKMKFIGHEKIGAEMLDGVCQRLRLSNKETDSIKALTLHHLRPGYLAEDESVSKKAVFRLLRDAGQDSAGVLLLSLADKLATRGPLTSGEAIERHRGFVFKVLGEYFSVKAAAPPPKLLNGDELMRELNLAPGPQIGVILREIEEAQVDGQIKSKEEAIAFAMKIKKEPKLSKNG